MNTTLLSVVRALFDFIYNYFSKAISEIKVWKYLQMITTYTVGDFILTKYNFL